MPGIGLDVLEVDAQVVGGVAEPVGTQVGRQQCLGLRGDINANDCANGLDIFGSSKSPDENSPGIGIGFVGKWVNKIHRPVGTVIDPFFQ